jgi:hypothetical protein
VPEFNLTADKGSVEPGLLDATDRDFKGQNGKTMAFGLRYVLSEPFAWKE